MALFSKNDSTTTPETAVKIAPAETPSKIPVGGKPISPAVAQLIAPVPSPIPDAAARNAAPAALSERQMYFQQLKVKIHQKLVERLDVQNMRSLPPETVRGEVRILVRDLCQSEKGLINSSEQERLMDDVLDETFGLGPLETLLKDPNISDILVNRFDRIYSGVFQQGYRLRALLRLFVCPGFYGRGGSAQ